MKASLVSLWELLMFCTRDLQHKVSNAHVGFYLLYESRSDFILFHCPALKGSKWAEMVCIIKAHNAWLSKKKARLLHANGRKMPSPKQRGSTMLRNTKEISWTGKLLSWQFWDDLLLFSFMKSKAPIHFCNYLWIHEIQSMIAWLQ